MVACFFANSRYPSFRNALYNALYIDYGCGVPRIKPITLPALKPADQREWGGLTVNEVRELAGIGRTRLYEMINAGNLLSRKVAARR